MFVFANTDKSPREEVCPLPSREATELVELTVLLPGFQAQALEEAAHQDGLTTGQFLRRLISQALRCSISPQSLQS
jgi:hypothetical protein